MKCHIKTVTARIATNIYNNRSFDDSKEDNTEGQMTGCGLPASSLGGRKSMRVSCCD